jgi:N-acetylglucosaminyldiphosphoundecaprenol N-acetyl-beta-D-mannosaminyltransferase
MGLSTQPAVAFSDTGIIGQQVETLDVSRYFSAAEIGGSIHTDDLQREVYCILGLPIDAIEMSAVVSNIDFAATRRAPFLLSTPNLNFLVRAQSDPEFRDSLLLSDLCPPDGMPVVWIARLMGLPIKRRVAGSDIFEALAARRSPARPLKLYLFGGADGVAATASKTINDERVGLQCVGSMSPGFGSVDELSRSEVIDEVNASNADFLMASLGALKGQLWLHRNRRRLGVPVRAHLGAVINFRAHAIRRAPHWLRNLGLEWLWRIKEEPHLWTRYLSDGLVLARLLVMYTLPLVMWSFWQRMRRGKQDFSILQAQPHEAVKVLVLVGAATAHDIEKAVACLRDIEARQTEVLIDLSRTQFIDARFFGLLLMFRKQLIERGSRLRVIGVSPSLERLFRLNGVTFLLATEDDARGPL